MTLEQVKAARPTRDWDARYGKDTGAWTTDMFVEAAYQESRPRSRCEVERRHLNDAGFW